MKRRIVSVLCCLPLLLGITDKVLDKSNLHNKFKLNIQDNQYPLEDVNSKFKKMKEESEQFKKQQMLKELGEGLKQQNEEKLREQKKQEEISSRGLSGEVEEIDFIISFYTNTKDENGGYTVTCTGQPLQYGIVASNVYPLGTKIYLEGYGLFTVADRGGSHFDNYNRLDVLIPKEGDESVSQYRRRVNNMGKPHVKGYIQIK
ncbi:3D domain-containing protein [Clostridium perfringens]|uniref:3D domain-containing protein n=1 Tax=Clostridium perfringens TaxID=1502 RepID=UPI000708E9E9|nr:3D domain-containing protein [Clostridium perfringens]